MNPITILNLKEQAKDYIEDYPAWIKANKIERNDHYEHKWDLFKVDSIDLEGELANVKVMLIQTVISTDGSYEWYYPYIEGNFKELDIHARDVFDNRYTSSDFLGNIYKFKDHKISLSRKYLKLLNGIMAGELSFSPKTTTNLVADISHFIIADL
ncbi:MAG: hypothetical protein ACJAXY_002110 [Nonlabens sp.]|jgi:hypothetical protein